MALLLGFANSTFQASGKRCGHSNWTAAAENGTVPVLGYSIEHWDNFERDLELMKKLGVNSYRFSIEWSHIEPEQGNINEVAMMGYQKLIRTCWRHEIEPIVTLYHFNEPLWFTQLSSFEKEENIRFFTDFCQIVFNTFHRDVNIWCTINEPNSQAISSYLLGIFPPHQYNIKKTVRFLLNLLRAHVSVYKMLKQQPGGEKAKIGCIHHVLRFVPRYWWEPIERWLAGFLTNISDDLVLNFLKSGHFDFKRLWLKEQYYDSSAPSSYDFIGLNFYANVVMGFNRQNLFGATCFPHQELGDMYCAVDAQGFSHAIDAVAKLGKPIYITETGIADKSDRLKVKLLKEYFQVLKDKCQKGVNICGCYFWTFADNYEWNHGYSKKFGLMDHTRMVRPSANEFKRQLDELKVINLSKSA